MANAPRDANRVPVLLGTSNVDGVTPVNIYADPATGRLYTTSTLSAGTNVIGKARLVTATGDEVTEDTDDSIKTTIVSDDVGLATSDKQLPDDHNVTVSNMIPAVETGLATSAKQLADGHNVTVANGAAGAAVNIQDGGNTITVDGTVTATLSGSINNTSFATTKTALTPSAPDTYTVTTSTSEAVASNASRKGLTIVNLSDNIVFIGIGSNAVLNSGIALNKYGSFSMDEYTFATGAVNVITTTGGATIAINEWE